MSTVSLTLAFRVGQGSGRPGSERFDIAFRVGQGAGLPGTVSLPMVFSVKGLGLPGQKVLQVVFSVNAPEPTTFIYADGDWTPSAQRVWTGSEWIPPVT